MQTSHDESVPSSSDDHKPEYSKLVINARGEKIITTQTTIGGLGLPGTFFDSMPGSSEIEEIFLDHDANAVRTLLNALAFARADVAEALEFICVTIAQTTPYQLRALLRFAGLAWMIPLQFASCFDDPSLLETTCEVQWSKRWVEVKGGSLDVVQHFLDLCGLQRWHALHQFGLVDEHEQLYGAGDECTIIEYGGYVPLGLCFDQDGRSRKEQARLIFDVGHGNVIRPSGLKLHIQIPSYRPGINDHGLTSFLTVEVEGISEFSPDLKPIVNARISITREHLSYTWEQQPQDRTGLEHEGPRDRFDACPAFQISMPVPQIRRGLFRMLRISVSARDCRVGCFDVKIFGDLLQSIPDELLPHSLEEFIVVDSYASYDRVTEPEQTPYRQSCVWL